MGKYLKLYEKWAKTGLIEDAPKKMRDSWLGGYGGLCNTVLHNDIELFEPAGSDFVDLENQVYWANDDSDISDETIYKFNFFRQNIVLLLAAINNEL